MKTSSSDEDPSISLMADHQISTKEVFLPCYSLGNSRNKAFHGQQDVLKRLDEVLLHDEVHTNDSVTSSRTPDTPIELRAFVMCGIGGLGKSEIAIEWMHTRKTRFAAVFWVNSATTQKLDSGFHDIAVKLGLEAEDTLHEDPVATREIVKGWLSNPRRQLAKAPQEQDFDIRWMLAFDNADNPDILHDFWPAGGAGSVLVTSRNPRAKQDTFAELPGLDLPPMTLEEAAFLLQKLSLRENKADSLQICRKIAENLGCLPLALVQMAYAVRSKQLSLEESKDFYKEDAKHFQEIAVPGLTRNQTVASTWFIESLPAPATALLHVLSILDADMIPEDILTCGASKIGIEQYPKTKVANLKAREDLIKSSLVTRNNDLGFVKIHRLVQDVVRRKLSVEELRAAYDGGVTLVTAVWPFVNDSNLNQVDRLRNVQKYLPQLAALRSVLEQSTSEIMQPHIKVSALFNEASWFFILQPTGYGLLDAENFALLSQQVIESSHESYDEKLSSKLLADSYRYQGIAGASRDDPTAVSKCMKWLEILVDRIARYGMDEDKRTLPIAYNEIGMAQMRIPDEVEAVKSWVISCESLVENTPPGALVFPFPWVHRGIVAAQSGDATEAEDLVAPILKAREAQLGIDDTSTIETGVMLVFMGNFRLFQGRKADAYDFHRRAAVVLKTTCGEHSVQASLGYYRLAVDQFDRGEYELAAENISKTISFFGDVPWYKPQAARSAWKRGRALLASGSNDDKNEAAELLKRAMSLRKELAPEDDRDETDLVDADWDRLIYYFWR